MKHKSVISCIIAVVIVFSSAVLHSFGANDTAHIGDVNLDGKVNISDCSLMLKYVAKWDMSKWTFSMENADFNSDGKVNISDVSLVLKECINYWNPDAEK